MSSGAVRATFELEPPGPDRAEALAAETHGRVVSEDRGRVVVECPLDNWAGDVTLLVSAVVAGEAMEAAAFTRCRLVGLELPGGLLPGPALGGEPLVVVGAIVKPALGLSPAEVADVAAAAAGAGALLVKDDEQLGDPAWCPLEERVRAVAKVLPPGVVHCANVTGSLGGLLDRARRAVDAGATGLMVNAVAQGVDSVLALRGLNLGVPILVHRAGSGPWCRNDRFGPTAAVLARLMRLCGADYVVGGAFGGKLFDTDDEVRANVAAAHEEVDGVRPSWSLIGGGIGGDNAVEQVDRVGGPGPGGIVLLLGSRAYRHPGGIGGGVAALVEALGTP